MTSITAGINKKATIGHVWNIHDPQFCGIDKPLLLALVDSVVEGKYYACVSREFLARKLGKSIRTISRSIARLKELGYIIVKRRFNQSNVISFANFYERTEYGKRRRKKQQETDDKPAEVKKFCPKSNRDKMAHTLCQNGPLTDQYSTDKHSTPTRSGGGVGVTVPEENQTAPASPTLTTTPERATSTSDSGAPSVKAAASEPERSPLDAIARLRDMFKPRKPAQTQEEAETARRVKAFLAEKRQRDLAPSPQQAATLTEATPEREAKRNAIREQLMAAGVNAEKLKGGL